MSRLLWALLVVGVVGVSTQARAIAPAAAARVPHLHAPTSTSSTTAAHASRIVSLSPAVTETLFALDVGSRIVGVTRFCDRPAAAQALPKVGGYTDVSLEAVLALRPDLVVAQPGQGQWNLVQRLREHHIEVFVVYTDTVVEAEAAVTALGELLGQTAQAQAQRLVARQQQALKPTALARPLRVVVVVGVSPLVVAGGNSFADTAVRAVGAHSAILPTDPAWPTWSLETLLARHVDVIVAADGAAQLPEFKRILAPLGAKAPRVIAADRAILMRPGPSFADDVATLRTLLQSVSP
jgi:iron complex transport system substrate-binding protein